MMRDSGSVKLYWSLSVGLAAAALLPSAAALSRARCSTTFWGHLDLGQPAFPPPQLLRQLVAPFVPVPPVFFLVGGLGLRQQLLHFLLQLPLLLLHPPITHRLVFAGVGLHLRPIQRHSPQFDRPGLQRHLQHLFK